MKPEDFFRLTKVTDAIYQADLARLQTILAEEQELRHALEDLAERERNGEAAMAQDAGAIRQYGGDILWKAWIGRRREAINLRLANVVARKLAAREMLTRSFGRNDVALRLLENARRDVRQDRALTASIQDQSLMILRGRAPDIGS